MATLLFGDKVRRLLSLRSRISHRKGELYAIHDRDIRKVVSNVGTLVERNVRQGQNLIEHFHFVFNVLSHIRHFEILSAAFDGAGSPAGDNAGLQAGPMKERDALSVPRVKGLLLIAIFQQFDPPISEHTVTIHQEELDASRPAL